MPKQSNNLLGDLPADGKARRDPIEDAIASLYRCLMDIDELSLRIDQAVRRAAVVAPVLHPAQERLAQVRNRVAVLHATLGAYWSQGQSRRWE
jgi:ABC-type transporter Mla subunit MlaD